MNATLIHITSFKLSVVLVQNMVYTPRFIHHLEYRLYFPENLREGEKKNPLYTHRSMNIAHHHLESDFLVR